jgi:hypothetical protein
MNPSDLEQVCERLLAPFDPKELKYKPAMVKGTRCLCLVYIDARVVQDRLDEVLGPAGWQDTYVELEGGSVKCRLSLRLSGEWIVKEDVGSPSEQPDAHDRVKAAFSDALKRAAVKFGIGRYLYRLGNAWVDYDAQTKKIKSTPPLPDWARPKNGKPAQAPAPPPAANGNGKKQTQVAPSGAVGSRPSNGEELYRRLVDYDARLAKQGVCPPGELVRHVVATGVKAGHSAQVSQWNAEAIGLAIKETKAFEAGRRRPKSPPAAPAAPVETGEAVDSETLAQLQELLAAKGKTPANVWNRLRINVEGERDLVHLTQAQAVEVIAALRKIPDVQTAAVGR